MTGRWDDVTDDQMPASVKRALDELVDTASAAGAGVAAVTLWDADRNVLGVLSTADIDGRWVAVHVDMDTGDDTPTVRWAALPRRRRWWWPWN